MGNWNVVLFPLPKEKQVETVSRKKSFPVYAEQASRIGLKFKVRSQQPAQEAWHGAWLKCRPQLLSWWAPRGVGDCVSMESWGLNPGMQQCMASGAEVESESRNERNWETVSLFNNTVKPQGGLWGTDWGLCRRTCSGYHKMCSLHMPCSNNGPWAHLLFRHRVSQHAQVTEGCCGQVHPERCWGK